MSKGSVTSSNTQLSIKPMKCHPNYIFDYVSSVNRSEINRATGSFMDDFTIPPIYLRQVLCRRDDYSILKHLSEEMEKLENENGTGMISWSKHYKYENPELATFGKIISWLGDYFDVDVHATRLNFYPDATSWKPYHHDSHAYGVQGVKEDFTMGCSFGDMRELAFKHVESGNEFTFPQYNGDIFAFDSTVNRHFQHGVPKTERSAGPRFSIIAWGRRRTINERNGGTEGEIIPNPMNSAELQRLEALEKKIDFTDVNFANSNKPGDRVNERGPTMKQVQKEVETFISQHSRREASVATRGKTTGMASTRAYTRGGGRGGSVNMSRITSNSSTSTRTSSLNDKLNNLDLNGEKQLTSTNNNNNTNQHRNGPKAVKQILKQDNDNYTNYTKGIKPDVKRNNSNNNIPKHNHHTSNTNTNTNTNTIQKTLKSTDNQKTTNLNDNNLNTTSTDNLERGNQDQRGRGRGRGGVQRGKGRQ